MKPSFAKPNANAKAKVNPNHYLLFTFILLLSFTLVPSITSNNPAEDNDEIKICGGFIEIETTDYPNLKQELDLSQIIIQSFTTDMIMKEQTSVAQSGYYFLPIYERQSLMLKISAPNGMKFEPEMFVFNVDEDNSIEDYCKEDNNFKFKGFLVEGQVSTFGQFEGPADVAISLYKIKGNSGPSKIQDSITLEGGKFEFAPVYPGKYLLKPTNSEDENRFDLNYRELNFEVSTNKPTFLSKALIIKGYSVKGNVRSVDGPAEGVFALIYSDDVGLIAAYECQNPEFGNLSDEVHEANKPFCLSKTDSLGNFVFHNIPYGSFTIKPLYRDSSIEYDFFPATVKVEVLHRDYIIDNPLQIKSFSVKGRVVNSKRAGIPGVNIKVDGTNKGISDQQGYYTLTNIVAGFYDLEATTQNMYFEPLQNIQMTIQSLKNKRINDFVLSLLKLGGKIHIEANEGVSTVKRTVILKEVETNAERRTITDIHGNYSFEVKPSLYRVLPILSQEEKDAELHLNPESIDVEITDEPRTDINFYQSKVEISGFITCLAECPLDMKIYLTSLKKQERIVSVNVEKVDTANNETSENDTKSSPSYKKKPYHFTFTFTNILSGQYKLSIQKFEWCWDQEEIIIKVQNQKITDIKFKQVGYSLFYSTQYNIKVDWANQDKTEQGSTSLKRTESKICLPHQGVYTLTPRSCHKFDQEEFVYDTEKKERLSLVPTEFLVNGSIILNKRVSEEVKKDLLKTMLMKITVEQIKEHSLETYKVIESININEEVMLFSFYTKAKTNLLITPEINYGEDNDVSSNLPSLLFFPKFKQIRVEESCSENHDNLRFEIRVGLVINGLVTPAMDGVKIIAIIKDPTSTSSTSVSTNQEEIASTETLPNGNYTIGPLYKEFDYEIKAIKDGYKIIASKEDPYRFIAEKLSFLRVKIVNQDAKPLSNVFLSLSSGNKGFKINSNTNAEGYFDFLELYSGEYYIKPMLKEYKFEPSQKMVKIDGGDHITETIVAVRVAFSIYGKINNLSKEKVEGITVQALNQQTNQLIETSIDKNMEYRLRGLTPDQTYEIKVKIPFKSSKFIYFRYRKSVTRSNNSPFRKSRFHWYRFSRSLQTQDS